MSIDQHINTGEAILKAVGDNAPHQGIRPETIIAAIAEATAHFDAARVKIEHARMKAAGVVE